MRFIANSLLSDLFKAPEIIKAFRQSISFVIQALIRDTVAISVNKS